MSGRIGPESIFLWNIIEFKFITSLIIIVISKLIKDNKATQDMYALYHFSGVFFLMLFERIHFFQPTIVRNNKNTSKLIKSNITQYIFFKYWIQYYLRFLTREII